MTAEPNFVIGGAVASGTSFLSHAIKDHPEIYLPRIMRPECGFFYKSWEHSKGKEYYLSTWFSEVDGQKAIGERSSLYLHGDFNDVAGRIHAMYPNMKFIFCLRNPTERAWANYRFTVLTGLETLSFPKALKREEERRAAARGWKAEIQPNLYRARGCYYDLLMRFLEYFPKEQICCLKSETLSKNEDTELRRVFEFLGVSPDFKPAPQKAFTSPNVRSAALQSLFRRMLGPGLDKITENFRQGKSAPLHHKVVALNLTSGKRRMDDESRAHLNDYFAEHNRKLKELLGWDVSDWR